MKIGSFGNLEVIGGPKWVKADVKANN